MTGHQFPQFPRPSSIEALMGSGWSSRGADLTTSLTPSDLADMREWLAESAASQDAEPGDYLDADLIGDHEVLHLIEHGHFGATDRGIAGFLADGAQLASHHDTTALGADVTDAPADLHEDGDEL